MSKNKKNLIRVIVSLVIFFACLIVFNFTPLGEWRQSAEVWDFASPELYGYFIPFLTAYFIVGADVLFKAVRNIFSGRVFDEHLLMTIATIGAIVLGELSEAVAVMLFYQVGELFQSYAVNKSRKSISSLMDICPTTATVVRNGVMEDIFPEEVVVGDILLVRAGERIPVDGVVVEGHGSLDTSSLTGESIPREFCEGDEVLSGCINLTGAVKIRAEKAYEQSTVAKILDLVENSTSRKANAERFITKFARYYTPAVVFSAVALAVIPSLFVGDWSTWIERALTFLVVSCPCALVISVPLSFFGGIGCASKNGILIKGGSCLERLATVSVVALDKTGTLTEGRFEVTDVYPKERECEILRLAYVAESRSSHPIAKSILRYAPREQTDGYEFVEYGGKGIKASSADEKILVGTRSFLEENGVRINMTENSKSGVYLAKNGVFMGFIAVEDRLKSNAKEVISDLKRERIKTVMLSGDKQTVAKEIAKKVDVDEYFAELLPVDKVYKTQALMQKNQVCFVGDGINDAPVLNVADVGVSMGGIGSDVAIEASDVVLMKDDLSAIPMAIGIAKKTVGIVKQNVIFALGVKLLVLVLSAFGITGMWLAVFADVGVAVIAILNAMRALSIRKTKASFNN